MSEYRSVEIAADIVSARDRTVAVASRPAIDRRPRISRSVPMIRVRTRPRTAVTALLPLSAVALAFIAGCSATAGMMSKANGPSRQGYGVMMDGGGAATMPGYNYSALTCTAPPSAASTVHVVLADMGLHSMMGGTASMTARMMLQSTPATLHAGAVTFIAANRGWRTHELVLLPLAPRATAGQRVPGADGKVSEIGSLGEASTPCGAGAGSGIPAGSQSWARMTLAAGHYELICNLPNHYADGMHQELIVT